MPPAALLEDAAAGRLPDWVDVSDSRRGHMERVAALMGEWAAALRLPPEDRARWRAAGLLHDILREMPPDQLRPIVSAPLNEVAGKLLHGPAAAMRLREHGVADESVLRGRLERLLTDTRPIRPETAAFWNVVSSEHAT